MIIKKIRVKDYKQFIGEQEFEFNKLTLFKGKNGAGKTNIAVDSILFALYGYSVTKLEDIPTQGKKQCSVTIEVEQGDKIYEITREIPSVLKVLENGVAWNFTTLSGTQLNIDRLFGTCDYFRRFRLITNSRKYNKSQETNFLEEGKTTLNKILLSLNPTNFNGIRQRLLAKKLERETYNVLKLPNIGHFPSEKRLKTLITALNALETTYQLTKDKFATLRCACEETAREKGGYETELSQFKKQLDNLQRYDTCYTCKQKLPEVQRKEAIINKELEIKEVTEFLGQSQETYKAQKLEFDGFQGEYDRIRKTVEKLTTLKTKLQASIDTHTKQTKFIYTDLDVAIIKRAIDELDKFYSYYIKSNIETLAPIINSTIEKLGLKIEFVLDAKGNFDIVLHTQTQTFTYDFMSDGQRLIINVAFKLALLLERSESGLIIADEGFSSLDVENLQHLFSLFTNMPFQLVCILHRFEEIQSDIKVIDLSPKEEINERHKDSSIQSQEVIANPAPRVETATADTPKVKRGRPKKAQASATV
jgi:DNA repair exonuclease SbcCD ATPase subunit